MSRLEAAITRAFERARGEGRAALIPYLTAGYPRLDVLPELIRTLAEAGADLIEVGIPFSDPLADGPVLQQVAGEALARGTKVADIFQTLAGIPDPRPPILILTYINPILRRGVQTFAQWCAMARVSGVIIPDLPWDEGREIRRALSDQGVAMIPLVAPTTAEAQMRVLAGARGFVYAVSVTGVTGMRRTMAEGIGEMVARVRRHVDLPVAIGFGISTPDHARAVGKVADGVIVGSALMAAIRDNPESCSEAARRFVSSLRQALS